jgi:hypothetical protein
MLLPGVLAAEAPHFLRTSGIMPAVFLFPALGLSAGADWISRGRARVASMALCLVIAASGFFSLYGYFGLWAGRSDVYRAFWGDARDAVRYTTWLPSDSLVLVSGESYRLSANPGSLYAGADRVDRLFDGLRGIVIPPASGRERIYLLPSNHTRDDGAHCPFVPCFTPDTVLPGPSGEPAVGVFRVPAASSRPGPPPRIMDAWFGDNLTVRGYELNPLLAAGQVAHLTVHTTIGRPLRDGRDWKLFAHLVGPDGKLVASAYGEQLTPLSWQTGDDYVAWFDLMAPRDLTPGLYSIELGIFDSGSQARLPVSDAAGRLIGDALLIRPLRAPSPAVSPPPPSHALDVRLGDSVRLLGYDIAASPGRSTATVTLHWQAANRPSDDYTVFVHALSDGKLVAQQDSQPSSGQLPTSVWQPGEVVVDSHEVALPTGSSGRSLEIVVGMYQLASGQRLLVTSPGASADSVSLARVTVP